MKISENSEEYLELLWMLEEEGVKKVKISDIARRLKISAPSVVEMLWKLKKACLVEYGKKSGARLTKKGRSMGKRIVRNHRIAELLLTDILNVKLDEKATCGIEHHISDDISRAVCRIL